MHPIMRSAAETWKSVIKKIGEIRKIAWKITNFAWVSLGSHLSQGSKNDKTHVHISNSVYLEIGLRKLGPALHKSDPGGPNVVVCYRYLHNQKFENSSARVGR